MIKKANLLGKIDVLLDLDKGIVPLLNKHISSSLFFSVLKESERSRAAPTPILSSHSTWTS